MKKNDQSKDKAPMGCVYAGPEYFNQTPAPSMGELIKEAAELVKAYPANYADDSEPETDEELETLDVYNGPEYFEDK